MAYMSARYKEIKNAYNFTFLVLSMIMLIICSESLIAQTLSDVEKLKDLATPKTLIGSIGRVWDVEASNPKAREIYQSIYLHEFNVVTVLCFPMIIWKGLKEYDFDSFFNKSVNWFEKSGHIQLATLLVAPNNYYPEWFINGKYTNEELEGIMEDYIRSIMDSNNNGKKVEIWNVVNEPFWIPGGTYYAGTIWNQLGWEEDESGLIGADKKVSHHPVYIRKAFEYARKYTNGKLELRERRVEFPDGDHSQAFYQLVKHLINKKVPLDAVSFQTHLSSDNNYDWEGFKSNIKRFRDLGIEVYITELDVGNDNTKEGKEKQKQCYYNAVKSAREANVKLINLWGAVDGQMGEYREKESALIFYSDGTSKPAYYGIRKALADTQ